LAQLAAGDEVGYRRSCVRMRELTLDRLDVQRIDQLVDAAALISSTGGLVERASQAAAATGLRIKIQSNRKDWIAYTALFAPDAGIPTAELVAFAEAAVAADRKASQLERLGAALYRVGRLAEAEKTLAEAIRMGGKGTPWMHYFHAMSLHKLGETDKARAALADAGHPAETDGWVWRLIHSRLRSEAEELLGKQRP
jgi:hypothetical protein